MTPPASLGEDRGYCFRQKQEKTVSKWQLQDVARRLLPERKGLQRCHCTRHRGGGGVSLWRGSKGAWFTGLVQCGSVWICPVCANKVAEGRAGEVQRGIDYTIQTGGGCMMVTLTFSHG